MSVEKVQEVAKAIIAVLGTIVIVIAAIVEGVESFADALTVVAALGIPVGVYAVPNKKVE
ncbi:MAG: hypothetical protein LC650_01565 [Actinobacteria bacterium]|nr:hypothetical protein [Actinomycetota bacterium]